MHDLSAAGTDEIAGRRRQADGAADSPSPRTVWWLLWLALLPFALLRAGTLAESDTFWEIRTGLLTLQRHGIPARDPFSWTVTGHSWTLNSWGFNVVMAGAYRAAGLPAVALACTAMVATVLWLVLVAARRLGAAPAPTAIVLVLAMPLLIPYLSARPQLIDYLAVLALVLLLQAIIAGRPPLPLVTAVGILTLAWVNLHAAALLGVAIAAGTAALVVVRRRTRSRGGWCVLALLISLACSVINPYGISLLSQTAQVQSSSAGVVVEWRHLDPGNPFQLATFLLGVLALAVAVRRGEVAFAAALGVAAAGSVSAIRVLPILLLLAVPVLAQCASRPCVLDYLRSRRIMLVRCAALGLTAMVALATLALGHLGRPAPADYSSTVVSEIPSGCKVYNSYLLGGFVVLQRPDVAVSIDSRSDLYGAQRVIAAERVPLA